MNSRGCCFSGRFKSFRVLVLGEQAKHRETDGRYLVYSFKQWPYYSSRLDQLDYSDTRCGDGNAIKAALINADQSQLQTHGVVIWSVG